MLRPFVGLEFDIPRLMYLVAANLECHLELGYLEGQEVVVLLQLGHLEKPHHLHSDLVLFVGYLDLIVEWQEEFVIHLDCHCLGHCVDI